MARKERNRAAGAPAHRDGDRLGDREELPRASSADDGAQQIPAEAAEAQESSPGASQRAHESIANKIRQRNSEAYSAFYQQIERLLVGFETLEPRLVEALEPRLVQISEQLAKSIELAGEPRQIRAVYLGDDRMLSLRFLSACGGLAIVFGLLVGLMAPDLWDNWSVWQAARLIDSPAEICRLIEAEYATTDCTVPQQERELGLRVIEHEDRR